MIQRRKLHKAGDGGMSLAKTAGLVTLFFYIHLFIQKNRRDGSLGTGKVLLLEKCETEFLSPCFF